MPGTAFSSSNWSGYDEHATNLAPSAALTDFTLIVNIANLSSTFDSTVQSDGADIRVTKQDGTTELPYDLIDWAYNAGAPTGFLRIKWSSTLATSGTQKVRIWAGYTPGTAVAYDATETYGSNNAYDANWLAYYPDGGVSGTDHTSNGLTLTPTNSPTSSTGKLGTATDYAATQYATSTDASFTALPATYDFTVMCWSYRDTVSNNSGAWSFSGTDDIVFYPNDNNLGSGDIRVFWRDLGGSILNVNGSDLSGAWHHNTFVSRASNDHEAYRNGSSVATSTNTGTEGPFSSFNLGGLEAIQTLIGDLDDAQVHSVARSDDWIAEEYSQTNDNATHFGSWTWTAVSAGSNIPAIMHHYRQLRVA